jgi:predicted glycogen debranching enzyme
VRQEFPETIFLLEGLGGSWEATENLLADGGMQWAYSELFQNYSGREVASYLDYSLRQSQRAGIWVHYSETHDNNRLAARGRAWSLLRNRLCALASASGGFGFTCGVEWLAAEKIVVHRCSGLAWDNGDNLVAELGKMNQLLAEHPCFFDGAICARLSPVDSPVYALRRDSSEGADRVLVLVNTDVEHPQKLCLSQAVYREIGEPAIDLLGQRPPQCQRLPNGEIEFSLEAGASFCLAAVAHPKGLGGAAYRQARARAAWALTALSHHIAPEQAGGYNWRVLADLVAGAGPERFLAALPELGQEQAQTDLGAAIGEVLASSHYPKVIHWNVADSQRVLLVPPDHWLLLSDTAPFRATLRAKNGARIQHTASIVVTGRHYACYAPNWTLGAATLSLERFAAENHHAEGQVQFLPVEPGPLPVFPIAGESGPVSPDLGMVLLTNGYGGMARLNVDLGGIKSKYDCLLAANLHPEWPVDRHVLAKRVRVWVSADGFLSPLDGQNLVAFTPGPPACWHFVANAGDGRSVEVHLEADMLDQRNTTVLRFSRSSKPPCKGKDLPADCAVYLTVRVEIEDRNFHAETKRDPGADHHFRTHCRMLPDRIGFVFQPASDRRLRVFSSAGLYHPQEEWSHQIPHPVELSRGQVASGDAYSPGWFELPLAKGAVVTVTICADPTNPTAAELRDFARRRRRVNEAVLRKAPLASNDAFGQQLVLATQAFLVRRGQGKTIIAGYPWFLDWGRDALICARGLLAAGMIQDVIHLLTTFGCLVENGTLPNSVQGDNTTNRDSSDAPLWFGLVCEEANGMAQKTSALKTSLYELVVDARGGTIGHILRQIAKAYIHGTYHGIQMDPGSGLIFSPTHFTWMDTNYPACTPREGYPVEIQVLWIRLLRQLARLDQSTPHRSEAAHPSPRRPESWLALAERAQRSFHELFWLEDRGYWADLLIAKPGAPAKAAVVDNSLRSNYLLAISLDLVTGEHARRGVEAALLYLVVPGALRSLAPLPVSPPLPIHGHDGRLLNNPELPYWGRYEGNEDTQRKPAYHNGTAWTWTFPIFCEALAKAWNFSPSSVATAKAYLSSIVHLLAEGCLGHIPEILDGDAPHQQRGCDAQAWGATEALRVWKMLTESEH